MRLILGRLGFMMAGSGPVVKVAIPSWRSDVTGKADIVEEIMRIYGVDRVPMTPFPRGDNPRKPILTAIQLRTRRAKRAPDVAQAARPRPSISKSARREGSGMAEPFRGPAPDARSARTVMICIKPARCQGRVRSPGKVAFRLTRPHPPHAGPHHPPAHPPPAHAPPPESPYPRHPAPRTPIRNGVPEPLPQRPSEHHVFDWAAHAWRDPRTPDDLRRQLKAELADERWRESAMAMAETGVTHFVEFGGKVLSPMVKRSTHEDITTTSSRDGGFGPSLYRFQQSFD
eukprot:gene9532-12864_t